MSVIRHFWAHCLWRYQCCVSLMRLREPWCGNMAVLVNGWMHRKKRTKVWSYMVTVACFSSPALQRMSAVAWTRHFLLVASAGLNLLRTKWHLSKSRSPTVKTARYATAATKQALMWPGVGKRRIIVYNRTQKGNSLVGQSSELKCNSLQAGITAVAAFKQQLL